MNTNKIKYDLSKNLKLMANNNGWCNTYKLLLKKYNDGRYSVVIDCVKFGNASL